MIKWISHKSKKINQPLIWSDITMNLLHNYHKKTQLIITTSNTISRKINKANNLSKTNHINTNYNKIKTKTNHNNSSLYRL